MEIRFPGISMLTRLTFASPASGMITFGSLGKGNTKLSKRMNIRGLI